MVFAIIRKSDDYVLSIESVSRNPNGSEDWYEVETGFSFTKPYLSTWWKYDGISSFTDEGQRKTPTATEAMTHVVGYATALATMGFTGDPQVLGEIEAWIDSEIASIATLLELTTFTGDIFKVIAKALTALTYGWELNK